jgi:hypothetical protein
MSTPDPSAGDDVEAFADPALIDPVTTPEGAPESPDVSEEKP